MHDLVKTLLILSLLKQGLVFPNSSCLTSTDLSGHDNDTETGSEPLTGCLNLSLIARIREFVHELTPHTCNPCTAENSLTWAVWELDAHTASICITFPAWGDPDQMLWRTSCLLLSYYSFSFFLSIYQPSIFIFLQIRRLKIHTANTACMWSVMYFSYLQCSAALPAVCCSVVCARSTTAGLVSDVLLSDPNVTELCWNISAYQIAEHSSFLS